MHSAFLHTEERAYEDLRTRSHERAYEDPRTRSHERAYEDPRSHERACDT